MFDTTTDAGLDLVTLPRMSRERRQDGWVEKTGKRSKTWTGYFYEYVRQADGSEKRMQRCKVLGKCAEMTKGAAEESLRVHIRAGRPLESIATFEDLARWYLKTKQGLLSKKWGKTLAAIFEHQILPRLGPQLASELKRSDIQQALNAIAADPRSQSESMVGKCLTHIRAVFEFAIEDDLIERNPARKVEMPPTKARQERFLTLEECQRLLELADRRDNLILRLFFICGFRTGELFALRVNDLGPGTLRIDQTVVDYKLKDGAKTKASKGNVPVPPDLEADLRAYIRDEGITDLLFPSEAGTPISPDNYLDRTLKRLGMLANIDVIRNAAGEAISSGLNHQILRRTTGTHFQKHGKTKDTQALLRHTKASTTLEHYQKELPGSLIEAVDSWYAELLNVPKKGPGRVTAIDSSRKRLVN
jgi:integrase